MNYTKTSWENDITPVSAENMNKIENQLKALTDAIYPVGSVYLTFAEDNPSNLFGGNWTRIGVGRTLISAGQGIDPVADTNSYTGLGSYTGSTVAYPVGVTGGAETVTLTANQSGLRTHTHGLTVTGAPGYNHKVASGKSTSYEYTSYHSKRNLGGTANGNTALNAAEAHTNMPPYIPVYMWRRIA